MIFPHNWPTLPFSSSIFPSHLYTTIIPIHKKGSELICSNFRSIYLPSNLDKVLEKLRYSRFYDFLDKNRLIYPFNLVYANIYSTSYALLHMIEIIMEALDDGNFS